MRKHTSGRNAIWRDRRTWWISLGLFTLLLRWLLRSAPEVVETAYSRGIFLIIRQLQSTLWGWFPISIVVLLVPGLIGWWIWKWRKKRKKRKAAGIRWNWKQHLGQALLNLLSMSLGVLFVFNVLWGFNYGRVPLETTLNLEVRGLDVNRLCEEMEAAMLAAEAARAQIPGVTLDSITYAQMPDAVEAQVQSDLEATLHMLGYPAPAWGRVRARTVPTGTLLRLSISGIYNPFTGEGNIAGASRPPRHPATMAHEMAHGYGFGNEGTCNFLAILACTGSADPFVRYSGWMSYWYYIARELKKVDPLMYAMLRRQVSPGFHADLIANYHNSQKYRSWFSQIGLRINDAYLRTQGVKAGLNSYNRVANLFAEWRRLHP